MSFKDNKSFTKKYKSIKHLQKAIQRNQQWNRVFTPQGKIAVEMLELIAISAITITSTAAAGFKIGGWIGGPKGATIGAATGASIGAVATCFIAKWYLEVNPPEPDGSVKVAYSRVA